MREKERDGQSGTVDVFGPYSGEGGREGRGFQGVSGRPEKALEFTVSERFSEEHKGLSGRMNELDASTSIMCNMNITYKMPHVSTKL